MPRQYGSDQFRGKRNGLCGYVIKGKEGAFVRTINPNMSDRVKNAPEYANTRKYSRRFSMARSMASGQFNAQRFIAAYRGSSYTAFNLCKNLPLMQKKIYEYCVRVLNDDQNHEIGSQEMSGTGWQQGIVDLVNQYSANQLWQGSVQNFHVQVRYWTPSLPGGGKVYFQVPIYFNKMLRDMGYNYCAVVLRYVSSYVYYNTQHPGAEESSEARVERGLVTREVMRWEMDTSVGFTVDGTTILDETRGHRFARPDTNFCSYFVLQFCPYKGTRNNNIYQRSHNFYLAVQADEVNNLSIIPLDPSKQSDDDGVNM